MNFISVNQNLVCNLPIQLCFRDQKLPFKIMLCLKHEIDFEDKHNPYDLWVLSQNIYQRNQ